MDNTKTAQIQAVEKMLAALETEDRETFLELQTTNVNWEVFGNTTPISPTSIIDTQIIPFAGSWFGREGISRSVGDFFDATHESIEIEEFEQLDLLHREDRVIARVNVEAIVEETGLPYNIDMAYVVDFEDSEDEQGKIESVRVAYNSFFVAEAFAGETPSPEAVELNAINPLKGVSLSVNPDANSEETRQVVENTYSQLGQVNIEGFAQGLAEDAIFILDGDPSLIPIARLAEGPEGVEEFFQGLLSAYQPTTLNIEEVIADGDRAAVILNNRNFVKSNNFPIRFDSVQFITVEDDSIANVQVFTDTYPFASGLAGEPLFFEDGGLPDGDKQPEMPMPEPVDNSDDFSFSLGGSQLDSVVVSKENIFPEGVEYSSELGKFLLSSVNEGTIYEVSEDGTFLPFIEDERLISSAGILIDEERNRLLVTNLDPGVGMNSTPETENKLAALGIYDFSTGEPIAYADLGALRPDSPHIANDITIDGEGNAYVTDTFSPIIYKVDLEGNSSIFLENERFLGEGNNLNGIVYHPDGFLIASKTNEGLLFKVPLDNPEEFTQIEIGETFAGADGLLLADDDSLLLVANQPSNQIVALDSNDQWESATIVDRLATDDTFPTTATTKGEDVFVTNARLDVIFDPNNTTTVPEFTIQQVGSIEAETEVEGLTMNSTIEIEGEVITGFNRLFGEPRYQWNLPSPFDLLGATTVDALNPNGDEPIPLTASLPDDTVLVTTIDPYLEDIFPEFSLELVDPDALNVPLNEVPIISLPTLDTSPLPFLEEAPGVSQYQAGPSDPITKGDWFEGSGTMEIESTPEKTIVTIDVEDLVPNSLYSLWAMWYAPEVNPFSRGNFFPQPFTGTPSTFVTDQNGDANYVRELNFSPLEAAQEGIDGSLLLSVFAGFHSDDAIYGAIPARPLDGLPPGTITQFHLEWNFPDAATRLIPEEDQSSAGDEPPLFEDDGLPDIDPPVPVDQTDSSRGGVFGNDGNDELFAEGDDHIYGLAGDDLLDATNSSGDNILYGNYGNDTFFASSRDRLVGGDGDDTFFITDGGDNLLTGGAGADAFWIANGELPASANTITDFEIDKDVIGIAGLGAASVDDLNFNQVADYTMITFSGVDLAVLLNTNVSDLQANGTFVFA